MWVRVTDTSVQAVLRALREHTAMQQCCHRLRAAATVPPVSTASPDRRAAPCVRLVNTCHRLLRAAACLVARACTGRAQDCHPAYAAGFARQVDHTRTVLLLMYTFLAVIIRHSVSSWWCVQGNTHWAGRRRARCVLRARTERIRVLRWRLVPDRVLQEATAWRVQRVSSAVASLGVTALALLLSRRVCAYNMYHHGLVDHVVCGVQAVHHVRRAHLAQRRG